MPFFTCDNTKIFYQEQGSGKDVIFFIHGLGSRSDDWQEQIDFFSKNYRCIAVDIRGYGKSEAKPPFTIKSFATDIINLIDHLKLPKINLVGISLGGIIAFQIAVLRHDLLKSLVVVNALPEFKLKGLKQYWLFYSRFLFIRILGMKIFGKILARKLFPKKSQNNLRNKFAKSFVRNDKETYLSTLKSLIGWGVTRKLKLINCKTLFIASSDDYSPIRSKKFFAKKIKADIIQINNSHHVVPIEKPEEFNEVLNNFLKNI